MDREEKKYDFQMSANDIIFRIWSRKNPAKPDFDVETHAHMHYHSEFHYVYWGKEKIILSTGEAVEVSAGQFCIIPGDVYHSVWWGPDVERECFFLDIEYTGESPEREHSDYYLFSHILSRKKQVEVYENPFISAAMNEFAALSKKGIKRLDLQRGLMLINSIIKTVEGEYVNTSEQAESKSRHKSNALRYNRKRIIEEFISEYYMSNEGIGELARQLYLSPRQTHNVVKSLMGEDFKSLVVRQRINTANALMKTTDLTLDEISREIGYNSYSGFYMAYVKLMGYPPCRGNEE